MKIWKQRIQVFYQYIYGMMRARFFDRIEQMKEQFAYK